MPYSRFWLVLTAVTISGLAGAVGQTQPSVSTRPGTQPGAVPNARLSRLERRPVLSDEEYQQRADRLREAYSAPVEQWPKPTLDPGVQFNEFGPLPKPPFPAENPYSEQKVALGKFLFFSPALSASNSIACASCHDPDLSWADGREVAFGHERQANKRNAPSLMDVAYQTHFFWDGRADSLEQQALGPIMADNEMHADPKVVVDRLSALPEYPAMFAAAFGDASITMKRVAQAVSTFERTIVGGHSKFDQFQQTHKDPLMSDAAIRGLDLFRTTARCMNCHNGPNFTDNQFHNLGLSYYGREQHEDLGRYAVTKEPKDVGSFKTPSLRNVTHTSPYMHNGLFELQGVLALYNAGMPTLRRGADQAEDPLFPTKDALLRPLALNQHDMDDLTAFMTTLEEPKRRIHPPKLAAATIPALPEIEPGQ